MILLVGRTGTGKSTITKYLRPLSPVVSYTDREKRSDETEGVEHTFVTPEEFTRLKETEPIMAYTEIGNVRYMALKSQCTKDSVYVIDPKGVYNIGYDDENFIVYLWADVETRRKRTENRSDFDFDERNNDEDEEFTEFENMNIYDVWIDTCKNDPETIAKSILAMYNSKSIEEDDID